MKLKLLLCVCALFVLGDAYNILLVFPLMGKSHSILGEGFATNFLEAGHEVTIITPFPREKVPKNLYQIDISNLKEQFDPSTMMNISELVKSEMTIYQMAIMGPYFAEMAMKHEAVQKLLLDTTKKFDLVISEWFFTNLLSGVASVYECPFIWFSSMDPHALVTKLSDEPASPAYSVNIMSKNPPPFTFLKRVEELFSQFYMARLFDLSYLIFERRFYYGMYEEAANIRGITLPSLTEASQNSSIMFFNAQPILGVITRLPPNGRYIGGFHIDPNTKPLPQDLQKLFDESKNGVIYFSMGSNLKSKDIPEHIKRALLRMFGKFKQTVLWKFEEDLPDKPTNVHIVKWAPQPSILKHPNTRVFITHGGKLSTTETIHYGVPIIGIPIFGDQTLNMQVAVDKGFGLMVKFSDDLADKLEVALKEIIGNPKYSKKAKELSAIYHDLPVSPRQEMLHWVNHVIKTGGAHYLRSPSLDLNCIQKLYLDFIVVLTLVLYSLYKIGKLFCRGKCDKTETSVKKKNN